MAIPSSSSSSDRAAALVVGPALLISSILLIASARRRGASAPPRNGRESAAVRVQAWVRGSFARWRYWRVISACTLIQSVWRGAITRLASRSTKLWAATLIQAVWRGAIVRLWMKARARRAEQQRRAEMEHAASLLITRVVRRAARAITGAGEPAPIPTPPRAPANATVAASAAAAAAAGPPRGPPGRRNALAPLGANEQRSRDNRTNTGRGSAKKSKKARAAPIAQPSPPKPPAAQLKPAEPPAVVAAMPRLELPRAINSDAAKSSGEAEATKSGPGPIATSAAEPAAKPITKPAKAGPAPRISPRAIVWAACASIAALDLVLIYTMASPPADAARDGGAIGRFERASVHIDPMVPPSPLAVSSVSFDVSAWPFFGPPPSDQASSDLAAGIPRIAPPPKASEPAEPVPAVEEAATPVATPAAKRAAKAGGVTTISPADISLASGEPLQMPKRTLMAKASHPMPTPPSKVGSGPKATPQPVRAPSASLFARYASRFGAAAFGAAPVAEEAADPDADFDAPSMALVKPRMRVFWLTEAPPTPAENPLTRAFRGLATRFTPSTPRGGNLFGEVLSTALPAPFLAGLSAAALVIALSKVHILPAFIASAIIVGTVTRAQRLAASKMGASRFGPAEPAGWASGEPYTSVFD